MSIVLQVMWITQCSFLSQVSHHPMVVACHCEGTGWRLWGDSNLKSKFWGRSIQLDPVGVLTLEFDDGEVFQWSKVSLIDDSVIQNQFHADEFYIAGNNINIQPHTGKIVL